MKKQRSNDDEGRARAVNRGWNLVQNYRREDPQRHVSELTALNASDSLVEIPALLQSEMTIFQREVVEWLESAMLSWFTFFFALGERSAKDRLVEASDGLDKSSERLAAIAVQISHLPGRGTSWDLTVRGYGESVDSWATAIDLIAKGARFDRGSVANEGFQRLDQASTAAERIVDIGAGHAHFVDLQGALWALERLRPSKKVPAKKVDEAKEPWRRALTAAGSKLDWSPFPT